MVEHYIRTPYQRFFVDPIANLVWNRVSPNVITIFAAICGILVAPLLITGFAKTACIFLLLSGYCDTLDGTLARLQNKISPTGSMLDIVCDRIVEFAVILGLYGIVPFERGWLALGMLGSILICVTTFLVVGIFSENQSQKSFHYSPGIMERPEAFAFFIAMILLPLLFNILAMLFIFLVMFTALLRVYQFCQQNKFTTKNTRVHEKIF